MSANYPQKLMLLIKGRDMRKAIFFCNNRVYWRSINSNLLESIFGTFLTAEELTEFMDHYRIDLCN